MDYNARYYSPVLGRFVSPDSIVPEPSSSGGFNRYRYARNSPLMFSDPTGHFPCENAFGNCTPPKPEEKPTPPRPSNRYLIPGTTWELINPEGDGAVSYYTQPSYPNYNDPFSLPSDQEIHARTQGTAIFNGQAWSYILDGDNSRWEINDTVTELGCTSGFASSTQCLTPLDREEHRTLPPASGAVQSLENDGQIPLGQTERIYIDVPGNRPWHDKVINPRDGCPGCGPLQIDIFSPRAMIVTYNTDPTVSSVPVYFWRMVEDPNCIRGACP